MTQREFLIIDTINCEGWDCGQWRIGSDPKGADNTRDYYGTRECEPIPPGSAYIAVWLSHADYDRHPFPVKEDRRLTIDDDTWLLLFKLD